MGRQHLCVLLLAAIALTVQASEDPTESLAGVHDLSEILLIYRAAALLTPSNMASIRPLFLTIITILPRCTVAYSHAMACCASKGWKHAFLSPHRLLQGPCRVQIARYYSDQNAAKQPRF